MGAASKGKKSNVMPGFRTMMLQERCGYILAAENDSDQAAGLQVDSADSLNMVSSREGGALGCIDLVPPRSRKLVLALAPKQGARSNSISCGMELLPPEAATWAVGSEDLHQALPPVPPQPGRPVADQAILSAERPSRRARPLAHRGGHKTPTAPATAEASFHNDEEADALAEALRMSMEGAATSGPQASEEGNADDELAEAIRLSMQEQPAQRMEDDPMQGPPAAAATAASAPTVNSSQPAAAAKAGATAPKELVKQLFEEFRRRGMPPNEAALKAVEAAKARAAR